MSEVSSLDSVVVEDGLLEIRRGPAAETCVIRVSGELDLASVESLERELRHAETLDPKTIVLDLRGLDFIDSTGILLLVQASRRAEANGHALGLTQASDAVQRVLELSGLDRVLPFVDEKESLS